MLGAGLGILVLFHFYALFQATLAKPDLIPEWRKGPLVHDASPYSSQNAHRIFWPVAVLTFDAYLAMAVCWKRSIADRVARTPGTRVLGAFAPALLLAVSLGIGEEATRLFIRHFMFLQCRPHPDLLWYNRPNLREHSDETDSVPKSTDSRGFRGTNDIPQSRASGEIRVFLLGDSSTFGLGVPDDATYGHVLEKALRQSTGRPVRVINSACPGHTSLEGLFLLQKSGMALRPDLVVWTYNNDPCLDILPEKSRYTGGPRVRALNRVLYRSDLYLLFHQVAVDALHGWNAEEYRRTFRREEAGWVRRIPFDDFKDYLEQFTRIAKQGGSRILFLRMPLNRAICEQMPIYYTSFDDRYRDYLAEFCKDRDLPYLDFESLFLSRHDPALFLEGHLFHPSAPGHRIIGERMADYVASRQLLRSAP